MLVRDRNNVLDIVSNAWSLVKNKQIEELREAADLAVAGYKRDMRYLELSEALDLVGVEAAADVAWAIVAKHSVIGYRTSGLIAEIEAARAKVSSPPASVYISTEPAYQELDLALSMAKSKWTDLQSPLYALMADLGSATDYDGIRMGIRTFTKSIT